MKFKNHNLRSYQSGYSRCIRLWALNLWLWAILVFCASGQSTNHLQPAVSTVMTDTNGVLQTPTNFFAANSNLLNASVTGGGGSQSPITADVNYAGHKATNGDILIFTNIINKGPATNSFAGFGNGGVLTNWFVNAGAGLLAATNNGNVTITTNGSVGGSGSVTSVTFTGDGIVDSSSPSTAVTATGTVLATPLTQVSNTFLAGPASGSAVNPSFRALANADFSKTLAPAMNATNLTNVVYSNLVGNVPFGLIGATRIVFDGDSLTALLANSGVDGGSNHAFFLVNLFLTNFANIIASSNFGVGGQTLQTCLANYTSKVHPLRPASGTNAVIMIWAGVNDMGSRTETQIESDLTNYWGQARADGFKVCAFTITDGFGTTGASEDIRNNVNRFIRTNISSFDYLVDVDSVFHFTSTNAPYVISDGLGIHFNIPAMYAIGAMDYEALTRPYPKVSNPDFNTLFERITVGSVLTCTTNMGSISTIDFRKASGPYAYLTNNTTWIFTNQAEGSHLEMFVTALPFTFTNIWPLGICWTTPAATALPIQSTNTDKYIFDVRGGIVYGQQITNYACNNPIPNVYWAKCNDSVGSTNLTDSSGNGFNGGVHVTTQWTNGYLGRQAIGFNGSTDFAVTSGNVTYGANVITVCAWVLINTTSDCLLLESGTSGPSADANAWDITPNDNGVFTMTQTSSHTTGHLAVAYNQPTSGVWTHVCTVYDNSTSTGIVTTYFNGILQTQSINFPASPSGTANFAALRLNIGSRNSGGSLPFTGAIQDIRIYTGDQSALIPKIMANVY